MKLVVAGLATFGALFLMYMLIGPSFDGTAFTVSNHPVSYLMACGAVVGFVFWRIVRGK